MVASWTKATEIIATQKLTFLILNSVIIETIILEKW